MGQFLLTAWHADLLVLLTTALVVGGYAGATRGSRTGGALWFGAGLLVLALAVLSPLDALARAYLLSAHMAQHLLLSQVIPPLLLLGLPAPLVERALRHRAVAAVERTIRRPLLAWTVGIGTLWLWHTPALFDLAATSHPLRHVQHLSVLAAGLVFWWPVFAPLSGSRLEAPHTVAYLASACLASTVLGMMLTFAPDAVYATYRDPADQYGILASLRAAGLTSRVDQQIGGLMMWVPCCALYVGAIAVVVARWLSAGELDLRLERAEQG